MAKRNRPKKMRLFKPRHSLAQTLEILRVANKRKPTKKREPDQITTAGKPDEDRAVTDARTVRLPDLTM